VEEEQAVCPICGQTACNPILEMSMGITTKRWADRQEELRVSGFNVTERVYLDASGKATTDESQANSLWATPGDEKTTEEAADVGYKVPTSEKVASKGESGKVERDADNAAAPATKKAPAKG
jgi:hypothetical protein